MKYFCIVLSSLSPLKGRYVCMYVHVCVCIQACAYELKNQLVQVSSAALSKKKKKLKKLNVADSYIPVPSFAIPFY